MNDNVINGELAELHPKYRVDNGYTGFNTNNSSATRHFNTPPGIIHFKGLYHIFYVDNKGTGIMHITSADGKNWLKAASFYTGFTTTGGAYPIFIGAKLYVFFRDGAGKRLLHIQSSDGDKWEPAPDWYIGFNIDGHPSAALINWRVCVIGLDHNGRGIMRGVKNFPGGKWDNGYTGYDCSALPCIVTFGGLFHIFFRDSNGSGIMHISSNDGLKWIHKSSWFTGFHASSGPAAIVFNNTLYVFFRDESVNGILYIQSADGDNWSAATNWDFGMNCDSEPQITAAADGTSMCLTCIDRNGTGVMRSVFTNW